MGYRMKYGNRKVKTKDGEFDSIAEYKRWQELRLLEKAEKIHNLRRQPPFEVIPKQKGERRCMYTADFQYTENGVEIIEDVKSVITKKNPDYIIKRKLFKQKYGKLYEFREEVR